MFISLLKLSLLSFISCNGFDPDIDICSNPVLSAGVYTDDGNSYIFKGKYFWQTNNLLKNNAGIIGFAKVLSDKWPDLTDEVKASFTVLTGGQKMMTVFVVKEKWFAYEKGVKQLSGSTLDWPKFRDLKVTTMFATDYRSERVFILHNDNNNFTLFNFADINKPVKRKEGITETHEEFIWFLDQPEEQKSPKSKLRSGTTQSEPLKQLIDVKAALTYEKRLVLISKDLYCVVELEAQLFDKKCITAGNTVYKLLNCPLDVSQRPSTTLPLRTAQINNQSATISSSDNLSNDATDKSDLKITTPQTGAARETTDSHQNKSKFWAIVFIISLIVITLITVAIIAIVSKTGKKRPKGSVVYVKS